MNTGGDVRALVDKLKKVDIIMHRKLWRELDLKEKPGAIMLLGRLLTRERAGDGGVRVSDLAANSDVTASGITQIVTALEERGQVRRDMDPDDRRAVRVHLTDEGRAAAERVMASVDSVFGGLVAHLGKAKTRELIELLSLVTEYFDRPKADAASAPREGAHRS